VSHHRADESTMNCCDTDMSPASDIEYRQSPCEFSNNDTLFSDVCPSGSASFYSQNLSKVTNDCGSDNANDSSGDEAACIPPPERYSANIQREVNIHRAEECGENKNYAASERDIDRNCNHLFSSDYKHDVCVDDNLNELDCSHDQTTEDRASPSVTANYTTTDRMSWSYTPSRETHAGTDSLQDTSSVRMV